MTDAIGKATDVRLTLAYGSSKLALKLLGKGVVVLAAGAVLVFLQPDNFFDWAVVALALAVGAPCALYGLARWLKPKPMLILSPAGLRLHFDFLKDIVIPWREVRGVDSIDISGGFHYKYRFAASGVTVVLVSRDFYDRHIHVRSWFMRGPGWDYNFIPKGDMVQVALHHDWLSASAAELRTAVETRWRAFGKLARATASVPGR